MIEPEKKLVAPVRTQISLVKLRDELLARTLLTASDRELLFKINSCLYDIYPLS